MYSKQKKHANFVFAEMPYVTKKCLLDICFIAMHGIFELSILFFFQNLANFIMKLLQQNQ